MIKQKKALSEIVGYVLLIVIAISLSLLVYAWLKNQIPKESKECPENLALSLEDYNCNSIAKKINITIKNSGLFDVNGFLVKYSDKKNGLATKNMKGLYPINASSGQIFKILNSSESFREEFEYSSSIAEIEITPIKLINGKMLLCEKARVRQKISC